MLERAIVCNAAADSVWSNMKDAPQELMRVALRVLGAYTSRTRPDAADVRVLREAVSEPESTWEPDILAGHIIQLELHRKRRASGAA